MIKLMHVTCAPVIWISMEFYNNTISKPKQYFRKRSYEEQIYPTASEPRIRVTLLQIPKMFQVELALK